MSLIQNKKPTLVVITGPTAVGKTNLCVKIAQHFQTEIISADSRQFFRELSIGTAKPSINEMEDVVHHFVGSHSINTDFNVNDFEKDALLILQSLFKKKSIVILTGGSGLYIDALCNGFDNGMPEGNQLIREELNALYEKYGKSILQEKLKQLDPEFYKEIDLNNIVRLQRAIEVCIISGQPYSTLRLGQKKERPFNIIKIGLKREREELFKRINLRVDQMIQEGLINEVKSVEKYKSKNALKTVGYTELFDYLENKTNLDEAIEKIKVNTRRYAKRQIAWFNKNNNYTWFHPEKIKQIVHFIIQETNK